MARRSSLRASDEDRERVTERLREAAAEGRLLAHELEERLAAALRARTYGELDPLISDLPGRRIERRRSSPPRHWAVPAAGLVIAIPIALAVIAAVAVLVMGFLTLWALWVFIAWWFFGRGHRRHAYRARGYGSRAYGGYRSRPRLHL